METESSVSDEDDNIASLQLYLDFVDHHVRPRMLRDRANPVDDFDDVDFRARYRLDKGAVAMLLGLIGHGLVNLSRRGVPVSPINQLAIALRFYAWASFQVSSVPSSFKYINMWINYF